VDVYAEMSLQKNAWERIVSSGQIIAAAPDIIVSSAPGATGNSFRRRSPRNPALPSFRLSAGFLHEIKSLLILQPGPEAPTEGLDALVRFVDE
jgi:iron complex transport system substrate-binding protein